MEAKAPKPFPSDLTDEQREVLEVVIPAEKSGKQGGRHCGVNTRDVIDAAL